MISQNIMTSDKNAMSQLQAKISSIVTVQLALSTSVWCVENQKRLNNFDKYEIFMARNVD